MDVLGNQSPFEVFFIEENLILWQEGSLVVSSALKLRRCSKGEDVIPQNNDLSKKAVCTDKKKKSQSQSSEHGVRQSIYQKKTEKYSPVGLLCWRNGFGTISFYQNKQSWSQRSICDKGRVLKRNLRICKYKTECQDPFTRQKHSTWVSVEDITSATAEKEQQRKDCTRDKMKKKDCEKTGNMCPKPFFRLQIPLRQEDNFEEFRDQGYEISFNPEADDNFQFSALSHHLLLVIVC